MDELLKIDLKSFGVTDVGVLLAIIFITAAIRRALKLADRWLPFVPMLLGFIAGMTVIPESVTLANWQVIVKTGLLYGGASAWLFKTFKELFRPE